MIFKKELMHCSICKSANLNIVFNDSIEASEWNLNGIQYCYIQCEECGFLQCNPIPSNNDLFQFYQEQYAYEWFQKNSFFKKWQAKHRYKKIEKFIRRTDKILDFGCGHGYFVQALSKMKLKCFGFDIGADKISHHQNGNITNKSSLLDYKEEGFDVITLWHVLEHMQDQQIILQQLNQKLTTNGRIIIAVPNTKSYAFKQLGTKWGWLQQPYTHINQFNAQNLQLLLQQNGFKIEKVASSDTWDQSLYDYFISLLFYKKKSRNTVRHFNEDAGSKLIFRINQLVRLIFLPVSYLFTYLIIDKLERNELLIVAYK